MTRRVHSAGVLLVLMASCGSPTSPSVPNVEGVWRGTTVATGCTSTLSLLCESWLPRGAPVTLGAMNLRLNQADTSFRGFLFICGGEDDQMAGTIASNGALTISSTRGSVAFFGPMTASLALLISGTVMTGSFTCTLQDSGATTVTLTGTVENLTLYSRNPNQNF